MIRNDLHVHSIQSSCGLHTILELVNIAAQKGMRAINVCDHGSASGRRMNFSVVSNKKRCPQVIESPFGSAVTVLAGIEANILDVEGNSDFPERYIAQFDLVSAGFHPPAKSLFSARSAELNTRALENYLARYPLDILTHPCISTFPLELEKVVDLSVRYGFALEVNNTNLRVDKTNLAQLRQMIELAIERGASLVENSDGHSFYEIGENEKVEDLLDELRLSGPDIFLNRKDEVLDRFLLERREIRKVERQDG